jgi:hypothetical protein
MTAGAKVSHSGAQGPTGATGPTGPTGPQGPQGALANNLTNVNFADQTSNPTTPVSSTNIFAKTLAGRGLAQEQNEVGVPYYLGSAPWSKSYVMLMASAAATAASTTPNTIGPVFAVTSTASTTQASAGTFGIYSELVSSASSNTNALVRTATYFYLQQSTTLYSGGLFYMARFYLPDANYTAATSTQSYLFSGLADNVSTQLLTANGNATGTRMAFQYANDGTVNQTTWQFITADGTGRNIINTGLSMTPQHVYETYIYGANSTGPVYWQINDLTAGTSASGSTSTNIPPANVVMMMGLGVNTTGAWTAGARRIQYVRLYVETDFG